MTPINQMHDDPTLHWPGKGIRPTTPAHLRELPELSCPSADCDNRLILGDNLPALLALEAEFAGAVHCIYLDPPYNTGAVHHHYTDRQSHAAWLSWLHDRLDVLRRLLHPDGVVFAHIDDAEGPYLKVLLDEVFGRDRHLVTLYLQVRYPTKTLKEGLPFHKVIEQIHCYGGPGRPILRRPLEAYDLARFCWYVDELAEPRVEQIGGRPVSVFAPGGFTVRRGEPSQTALKQIWATGTILAGNSSGRFFRDFLHGRGDRDGYGVLYKVPGIGADGRGWRYFTGPNRVGATKGKYYQGVPLSAAAGRRRPLANLLDYAADFGNCRHEGGVDFRAGKKPERLLRELLQLATQPGDLVLDPFAGSGTTGAVGQQLGRRWILIEQGEQGRTHIVPRLRVESARPGHTCGFRCFETTGSGPVA